MHTAYSLLQLISYLSCLLLLLRKLSAVAVFLFVKSEFLDSSTFRPDKRIPANLWLLHISEFILPMRLTTIEKCATFTISNKWISASLQILPVTANEWEAEDDEI